MQRHQTSSLLKTRLSKLTSSSIYHTLSFSLLENHLNPTQFHQILSHAISSGHFLDPFVSSRLLYYSLSDPNTSLSFSRSLFFHIQNPNVFAWNFLLRAHSQSSSPAEALALYNQMRRTGQLPDKYTFPFVLKASARLARLDKGQEIHCLTVNLGLQSDAFVQNSLIFMYCQCGYAEIARKVFDMFPASCRDVVTWNSIISGYLQRNDCVEALKMFIEMWGDSNLRPNDVTLVSAITVCARIGLVNLGRKLHGLILVSGFVLDVYLGSSLIDMYSKCGQLRNARKVFDRMPDRNKVCWTSMIAGYVQSGLYQEGMGLFSDMLMSGVKADSPTVACVLSACGHSGALDQGRWVHFYCETSGIEMNLTVKNALVDMYSKCGDLDRALEVFHALTSKDIFSWSAMISGLAMNGQSEQALQLFSQMEVASDVRPNEVTFLGVLSACNHGGFVDEGFKYFEAMSQHYRLTPRLEHYGCMIDLLGRASLLPEAEKFVKSMPIQPDVVIWRSLLFACRNHGNIELAEFAADKILRLEPERCNTRVLLSNAYASALRWSDVKRVRNDMAAQGIQKAPGCSFVEIKGLVHEFFVADCRHDCIEVICETIIGINEVLRSEASDQDFLDDIEQYDESALF